jgi:putative ABC transport system permease protein
VYDVLPFRLRTDVSYRTSILHQHVHVAIAAMDAGKNAHHDRQRLLHQNPDAKVIAGIELMEAMAREPNSVIVSGNFSALYHVHKGDTIDLNTPKGEVKFRVLGAIEDYTWSLGTIFMNRSDYVTYWDDHSVTVFDVFVPHDPGMDEETRLKKVVQARNLIKEQPYDLHPMTRLELKKHIVDMIDKLYLVALGQEIVVVMVSTLGVVTALLISVLQRRREMGLLRAIGASRAQVVYLVLAEAGLMGVLGSILGVLVAIPLQWYTLQIVFLEETGQIFPLLIPWLDAGLIALIAVAIATLAGVGPALFAVRERIPEAIAYE